MCIRDRQVQHFFMSPQLQSKAERECIETDKGRFLVLDAWLWGQLPALVRHAWLLDYVAQAHHPSPTCVFPVQEQVFSRRSIVHYLANSFSYTSGPNCFATALAAATPERHQATTISGMWLHQPAFFDGLHARGYTQQDYISVLDPDLRDSICVWYDAQGRAVHACWIIGNGLALNKNAQSWYAPRHIAMLCDILAYWQDDGLRCVVYYA